MTARARSRRMRPSPVSTRQQERPLLAARGSSPCPCRAASTDDHAHAGLDDGAPSPASPRAAADSARRAPRRSACRRRGGSRQPLPLEQFPRGRVDAVAPRREGAHMAPVAHARADRRARPRRRARAGRARPGARPPQARPGRRRSRRREARQRAGFAAAWGFRNAGHRLAPSPSVFRNLRNTGQKREAHAASLPSPAAHGIGAAFVGQKAEQRVHRRIIRPADQRRRLPLLRHQPGQDQPVQMMRQRRGGDADPLLQPADRQARMRRPAPACDRLAAASGCPAPRAAWRRVRASMDVTLAELGQAVKRYFRNFRNYVERAPHTNCGARCVHEKVAARGGERASLSGRQMKRLR